MYFKTLFTPLALVSLCSITLLANPYESNQETLESVLKTGKEVSSTLLKTLGKNLKKEMKSGGPMAAAHFCSSEAYILTEGVDKKFGKDISVKRISLKERNPANEATADEKKILQAMQVLQENGITLPDHFLQHLGQETYKYYKPLSINKQVCLKCHGDLSKNQKLSHYLKTTYPHDKATGYHLGDLRGAVVVTIKK